MTKYYSSEKIPIGAFIKTSYEIIIQNPKILLIVFFAYCLPTSFFEYIAFPHWQNFINPDGLENLIFSALISLMLIQIITGLVVMTLSCAYIPAVLDELDGKTMDLAQSISLWQKHLGHIVLLIITYNIIIHISAIFLLIPALIAACVLAVCTQACMAENLNTLESIQRSANLTEGYRDQIFVLYLLVFCAGGLCYIMLNFVANFILSFLPGLPLYIRSLFLNTVTAPIFAFTSIISIILYRFLIFVKEGPPNNTFSEVFD